MSQSKTPPTYFLNSDYSFRTALSITNPAMACLHTDIDVTLPLPSEVTVCYRSQPMLYQTDFDSCSSVLGFGTIMSDFTAMEEGVIFTICETVLWLGLKYRTSKSYKWVAMGDNFLSDLHIWRHTCFNIDFNSGHAKLVENGKVRFKTQADQIQKLGSTMNHVAAGCFYFSQSIYFSMHGRVTDVQIYGELLPDLEMEAITGCQSTREGDILSWDTGPWVMKEAKQIIRKESLDLESFICKSFRSLHIIPQKMNFIESLNVCKKFSAQMAGHNNEIEFAEITQYIKAW